MAIAPDQPAADAGSDSKHTKTPSRSLSLRALPSKLRPRATPSSNANGRDPTSSRLEPPRPDSPRKRRSSAPGEGSQPPESRANQFAAPPESDAEFVRRTYAHFSIAGVPDDGFSDGKEYTREKSGLSAWEEAALSRPESTKAVQSQISPNGQHAEAPGIAIAAALDAANGTTSRNRPPLHTAASTRSVATQQSLAASEQDGNEDVSRPTLTTSLSAQTVRSANTFLSTNERRRRQEVAEKRREELIANVDRYGFFSDGPSNVHNKAVLLPSSLFDAPFPKRGTKDIASQQVPLPSSLSIPSTSTHANGHDHAKAPAVQQARAAAVTVHRQREQERIAKWSRMLTVKGRDQGHNAVQFEFVNGIDRKVRRRIYKGIPDSWRSAAWTALLQNRRQTEEGRLSYTLAKSHISKTAASVSIDDPDARIFESLQAVSSAHDVQIDLDVPRTISGHIQFHTRYGQGQRALFHVLHAISTLCSQCGYCQGMGPIAATLLCYLSPEHAYAAMVTMHNHVNLHSTFSPGFPGLVENLFVQSTLLRKYTPELADAFERHGIVASSYATKWYITYFSNSIPFETQLRVWDAWLLDGQDVVTMVAVAVIWAHRGVILGEGADFETILSALSGFFVPEDDDALMGWVRRAMKRKDVRSTIRKAREEYRGMAERGEAGNLML